MTNRFRKILCSALFAVFALSIFAGHATSLAAGGGENVAKVFLASFEDVTGTVDGSRVSKANFSDSVLSGNFGKSETRTVIVSLEGENVISAANKGQTASEYLATASGRKTASAITAKQNTFYKRLNEKGVKYEKITAYSVLDNAVAIKIDTADIAAVKSIPGVRTAVVSRSYLYPQTVAVVNETNVYATGIYDSSDIIDEYSGEGMLVAVLDTGLDYTHAAFRKLPDDLSKIAYTKADVADILANKSLTAEETTPGLEVNDVFVSEKVPFAYDYADKDPDVYPSYSNHGTHVAGIIAGNDDHYNDKDGNLVEEPFVSVAPNAQLVICKVFTDDLEDDGIGGASTEDILAALEDCVLLNVDVINMSLGSTSGFTNTDDGDDDGEYMHRIYSSIKDSGISLICAGSNDYSSGYGGTFGTNLSSNPDSGTVGSPSTYAAALSVASISGQPSKYLLGNEGVEGYETAVFYEESNDGNSNPFNFAQDLLGDAETGEFEYVVIGGVGRISDYNNAARRLLPGRIALIKRGDTTFQEKVEIAKSMGAMGAIIYNNVSGKIRMSLGEIEDPIPAVSISMDAGKALVEGARHDSTANDIVGKIRIDKSLTAGPFMSDFSSWGATPDLRIKPEITAHGGEITSAVPGGYDEYSGTSMASPNMAGVAALVRGYVKDRFGITDRVEITRIVNQLIMSTATIVYDETDLPYSPRKQGAGLASLYSSIKKTDALLYVDDAYIDNRPKLEFGDDPSRTGVYGGTFYVRNFGTSGLTYNLSAIFMTETLASDNIAVAEKAYLLTDVAPQFTVDGAAASSVYVPAGESKAISVTLTLSDAEKNYIDSSFKNGMYVEGFVTLTPASDEYCNLNIPFLGFYGDWTDAPLLDYSAYEIAAFEQDTSILEDEKPKASVWATQPYAKYEEKYIIPLGSYVYNLDDNDEPMYTSEEHAAVSRYDADFHSTHEIYAIYAGLLRNARTANYTVTNVDTGELIYEDTIYRIGKASASRPAYVGLEFDPEINGLYENGHYKMDFNFALDYNGGNITGENNFSFSFYVDYDAPVLKEARIRYYDYKDGTRDKQRIYLDLDVYDNHYAQAILMCYVENNELMLSTDYVTPIRNAVKNGVTTVSIEITNLYDFFRNDRNGMYIQIEDYAMNWRTYRIDLASANTAVLPATFEVAENRISVGVNETYKAKLSYEGEANLSNFSWKTSDSSVAVVKNGEIFGVSAGRAIVTVSNGKQEKEINVTVRDKGTSPEPYPSISFGAIKNYHGSIVPAAGTVQVYPGQDIKLNVNYTPWYYQPSENFKLVWATTNDSVASVDQSGNVRTHKKGLAIISATIEGTAYTSTVSLRVRDEFEVSNYQLRSYHGEGGKVVIPTDLNIMYIYEEAFMDNDNITEIVIPSSVMEIHPRAFQNCRALKKVSFVQEDPMPIADAALTLINSDAFLGCTKLETIDLSNVKTITVGKQAFSGCTSLTNVICMEKIGTAHDRAFAGTPLTSVDITALHVSGKEVFKGCTSLSSVTTGRFTAIGDNMFSGCTSLTEITLNTPSIGEGAFSGTRLTSVTFADPDGEEVEYKIGANAFANLRTLTTVNFSAKVRAIGDGAFANTAITSFAMPEGLESIGKGILSGTSVEVVTLADDVDISGAYASSSPFAGITVNEFAVADSSAKYSVSDGVIYNKDKTALLLVPNGLAAGFEIPSTVTEIAANAFSDSPLAITINGNVITVGGVQSTLADLAKIGAYAFENGKVSSVNLPASVSFMGEGAFKGTNLASLTIPDNTNLNYIPASAFESTRISSVTLPSAIKSVGAFAFADTPITSFTFTGTELGDGALSSCTALTSIVLYDGIESMGSSVFADCTSLVSVVLPSVKSIGDFTFDGCTDLQSVTFGENATVIGQFTFLDATALTSVTLAEGIKTVDLYAFSGCTSLTSIDLSDIDTIEAYAFYDCFTLSNVIGLDGVLEIGEFAFSGTALTSVELDNVRSIGYGAFAEADRLTSASFENALVVGAYAFYGADLRNVNIPADLEKIGYGAFAYNDDLTAITVSANNESMYAEDGVLFRKAGNGAELVCYPAGKVDSEYAIPEGTLAIKAFAFAGADNINKVTMSYDLVTIGDSAFYDTTISEYTFYSIVAPILEAKYSEEIRSFIDSKNGNNYRGYYYSNFNVEYIDFSEFGSRRSNLIMNVPENGVGYDNLIYSTYFGTVRSLGILMDNYTRETISLIENLPEAEEIAQWLEKEVNAPNTEEVAALSETVKNARAHFDNIIDENQLAFIGDELAEKLVEAESEMRLVKKRFNIPVTVVRLTYNDAYRSEYVAGETFDNTGLEFTIIYDDGSTELADSSEMTLVTTGALGVYDRYVTYSGYGTTVRVMVAVSAAPDQGDSTGDDSTGDSGSVTPGDSDDDSSDTDSTSSKKPGGFSGCKGYAGAELGLLSAVLGLGALVILKKKR